MLLYLDLNCFNRPFDDQRQERVAQETDAVFSVLQRVVSGVDELAWSDILELENSQHPLPDRRTEIGRWAQRSAVWVRRDEPLLRRARELTAVALGVLDAAHLACAEAGGCQAFLTCDERLRKRALRAVLAVEIVNPVQYWETHGHGKRTGR